MRAEAVGDARRTRVLGGDGEDVRPVEGGDARRGIVAGEGEAVAPFRLGEEADHDEEVREDADTPLRRPAPPRDLRRRAGARTDGGEEIDLDRGLQRERPLEGGEALEDVRWALVVHGSSFY